jgi:Flp pilus assembly pilin Flp
MIGMKSNKAFGSKLNCRLTNKGFTNKGATLVESTDGASLLEYATLAGLISVVALGAVALVGEEVVSTFSKSKVALSENVANQTPPLGDERDNYNSWTMTAGRYDVNGNQYYGYRSSPSTVGSLVMTEPSMVPIAYVQNYFLSDGTERSILQFEGNVVGDVIGRTLTCDHGSWPLASGIYHYEVNNTTVVSWDMSDYGNNRPLFTEGSSYFCSVD